MRVTGHNINYGYIPQLGQCISTDTKFASVKHFVQQALSNLMMAHDAIIEAHVNQTHHANLARWPRGDYPPSSLVYLVTKNLVLPKGRAKKLLPKYIGPYKVVEVHMAASTITLELLPELKARWIHPTFHVNLIRAHIPNDDEKFPH